MRIIKKSRVKLHITGTNLEYAGSISIDTSILSSCDILENEQVHVLNVDNGERFITYAIGGIAGECCLNGAAAKKGKVGDQVIILTYELI